MPLNRFIALRMVFMKNSEFSRLRGRLSLGMFRVSLCRGVVPRAAPAFINLKGLCLPLVSRKKISYISCDLFSKIKLNVKRGRA